MFTPEIEKEIEVLEATAQVFAGAFPSVIVTVVPLEAGVSVHVDKLVRPTAVSVPNEKPAGKAAMIVFFGAVALSAPPGFPELVLNVNV